MRLQNITSVPEIFSIMNVAETKIRAITGLDIILGISSLDANIALEKRIILQETVCAYFEVTWKQIESQSRNKKNGTVDARHVYMYLARTLFRITLAEIAKDCGHRHHTSVISAIKKIKGFYRVGDGIIIDIEKIKNKLSNEIKIK